MRPFKECHRRKQGQLSHPGEADEGRYFRASGHECGRWPEEGHDAVTGTSRGASATHLVKRVATEMLRPVGLGALIGLAAGLGFGRLVESILFEVKATDATPIATPLLVLAFAAFLAALPPAIRAVRTDPAQTLRSE